MAFFREPAFFESKCILNSEGHLRELLLLTLEIAVGAWAFLGLPRETSDVVVNLKILCRMTVAFTTASTFCGFPV